MIIVDHAIDHSNHMARDLDDQATRRELKTISDDTVLIGYPQVWKFIGKSAAIARTLIRNGNDPGKTGLQHT